jgi:hypothetical protein
MLPSRQIAQSEKFTEEYGDRKETHFREDGAGFDGPPPVRQPSKLAKQAQQSRFQNPHDTNEGTWMRMQVRTDNVTGETFLDDVVVTENDTAKK